MRKLVLLAALVCLMGAGDTNGCSTLSKPTRAEEHLGNHAICSWHNGDRNNTEIDCVAAGRKFVCQVEGDNVQCAQVSPVAPAEAL